MTYLGIDFGLKRIGLALSDNGILARPLMNIENRGDKKNLATINEIIKNHNIQCIVCGIPHNSSIETEVRRFGNLLNAVFQDEYLSSVTASSIRSKKPLDAVAATVILQTYLDEKGEKS